MSLVSLGRSALVVLAVLVLSGCLPSAQSQSDEEKEAHFQAGKSRVNSMDYRGAIESFEKALEVNPLSAPAHFELGWLYDQKEPDPAAAIYHYEQYLKLEPKAGNAETARARILACKQELARTVSLEPVTQTMQHDFEQMSEENKRLREEVERWRAYYAGHAPPTNPAVNPMPVRAAAVVAPANPSVSSVAVAPASNGSPVVERSSTGPGRTHVVKAGETMSLIARMYGVRPDALQAANSPIDPRRLRIGQTLNIPSP